MKKVVIGDLEINENSPTYIIAEIGITACGSVEMAKQLIDVVKDSGCDAVKFHIVDPEELIADHSLTYTYENSNGKQTERLIDIFDRLNYSREEWKEIKEYTDKKNLPFLATCTSIKDIDFLEELGCLAYKIASWENNNYEFLKKVAKTKKPILIDTGPINLQEYTLVVDTLKSSGTQDIIPLHCTHAKNLNEVHLKSIQLIGDIIDTVPGYSAEGRSHELDLVAIGLGAKIIEKRLTLDRKHPEHHNSLGLEPNEFKEYINMIRRIDDALGKKELIPSAKDLELKKEHFRGLVASKKIKKGELLTIDNITSKRPLRDGIDPKHKDLILGTIAIRDFSENEAIIIK